MEGELFAYLIFFRRMIKVKLTNCCLTYLLYFYEFDEVGIKDEVLLTPDPIASPYAQDEEHKTQVKYLLE